MKNSTDVLVIGAGPSGLLLSNLLAKYGCRVILVEKLPELIDYPRAVGIDDESLRSMQAAGLATEVAAHISPQHAIRVLNGSGRVISEMSPTTEEFGWSRRNGFIQPLVDKVLYEGLDRFDDVKVLFGHEVLDLTESATGVAAEVKVVDSDETFTITADFVVGCEGGRSMTRKWMGADFEGVSTGTRWLVVDIDNDPLGTPNAIFGADPRRPHGSFGLPHGVRRWEFMLHDDEPDSLVNDDRFIFGLLGEHAPDPRSLDIARRRVFTHNARVASAFRKGRVLIAGDAAHLMPTWAGQGWNSCIRDATNLAWKLAAVVKGDATESLLDTYDRERRAHASAMVALSLNMGKVFGTTNKVVGGVRDGLALALNVVPKTKSYVTGMGWKPMPRYDSGVVVDAVSKEPGRSTGKMPTKRSRSLVSKVDSSGVGAQFPQPWVSTATQPSVRMDDVIGSGWNILVWGNDPEPLFSAESRAKLERLGAKLVRIVPEVRRTWTESNTSGEAIVIGDVDGRLKRWFDDRPFAVVFLRPDKFVGAVSLTGEADRTLTAVLQSMSFKERVSAG
ncbi:bifunctional 3-(3-hydroxy-phenyl)propionate/3-hydroxycinnamic acid hydroxylase [Rhodococcus hoagii]|nr:bifunctional 3-(3-hydroxy-phenyl)propionate/3-hydroxycinnamic acid hydroxylase [Prescottella equi]